MGPLLRTGIPASEADRWAERLGIEVTEEHAHLFAFCVSVIRSQDAARNS